MEMHMKQSVTTEFCKIRVSFFASDPYISKLKAQARSTCSSTFAYMCSSNAEDAHSSVHFYSFLIQFVCLPICPFPTRHSGEKEKFEIDETAASSFPSFAG